MTQERDVMPKVRRARLLDLIDRKAHGNAAEFARMHGIGQSLLNRYVTQTASTAKPMGYTAARNMELQIGLPAGYLDDAGDMPAGQKERAKRPAGSPSDAAVSAIEAMAGTVPPSRASIVSSLISSILTADPPNPVFGLLLREELGRHDIK